MGLSFPRPRWLRLPESSRGQSSPIGLILVLGIMMAGASAIVVLGAAAMEDTENSLSNQRAEKVMTQLDSKAALVALGNTNTQLVSLPRSSGDRFAVREETGWMNITVKNETSGDVTTVANKTLGGVEYEGSDGTTIAYQGGGVWRSESQGESIMVSPPEFHYRDATLTLPLVTVDGTDSLGSRARITDQEATTYFPNRTMDEDFVNPLTQGKINVTVHSEHYRAWGGYFQDRTEGEVTYDDAAETATAELVVPFDEAVDNVIATTDPDGITLNGNQSPPSPYDEGIHYPSPDTRIEDEISDCESGSCSSMTSDIDSAGTYYADSDYSGSVDVDSPGDNVTIVVNGQFDPSSVEVKTVADDHSVTVLVRNDFDINNDLNDVDGDPTEFKVLVHSDREVDLNGNVEFYGVIIAPESECDFNGNAKLVGGAICETLDINGNPNEFEYDPAIGDITLNLAAPGQSFITFLHISVNEVTVETG